MQRPGYKEYVLILTASQAKEILGPRSKGHGLYRILEFPHCTLSYFIPEWFLERYDVS